MYTNCSKYMNELLTLFSNHAGINASLSKSLYVLTELKTVEMSFISLFTVYMWQLTAIPMYCIFWLILYIVWLQDIYKYWHSRTHRVSRRAWRIQNFTAYVQISCRNVLHFKNCSVTYRTEHKQNRNRKDRLLNRNVMLESVQHHICQHKLHNKIKHSFSWLCF